MSKDYHIECVVCGKEFINSFRHSKYCSADCRNKVSREKSKRRTNYNLPSLTVAAMSELLIAIDLMKNGYTVFRNLSQSSFCDLIAIKNEIILQVEVRTGYKADTGNWTFPRIIRKTTNCIAVYDHNIPEILYLDNNYNKLSIK